MRPQEARFTKDRPCSKVEIWNCFWGPGQRYRAVNLVDAMSHVGRFVPRQLVAAGRAEIIRKPNEDVIRLTAEGKRWLSDGIVRYLTRNPDRREDVIRVNINWPFEI